LTATAIKFVRLCPEKCAVVYSTKGKIKWFYKSPDWWPFIHRDKKLDRRSLAYDFFIGEPMETDPAEIDADAWVESQGLDEIVASQLRLDLPPADLREWEKIVEAKKNPEAEVNVAMVGKYVDLRDAYISLSEALLHGGIKTRTRVNIHYFESQDIVDKGIECLKSMDGIVVPGGFGDRGIEGKIMAVQFARENGVPYLGICLGMQLAVIEAARNLAGLAGAHP